MDTFLKICIWPECEVVYFLLIWKSNVEYRTHLSAAVYPGMAMMLRSLKFVVQGGGCIKQRVNERLIPACLSHATTIIQGRHNATRSVSFFKHVNIWSITFLELFLIGISIMYSILAWALRWPLNSYFARQLTTLWGLRFGYYLVYVLPQFAPPQLIFLFGRTRAAA